MLQEIKRILHNDRRLFWVVVAGFIIQVITSLVQIGVSSADQHFQIVEFSMYQLGKPNGAVQVWEINNFVRPTLQVYLFSGYHLLCNLFRITDPYTQLTILRVILGIVMFVVFNLMAFHYFRKAAGNTLLYVLILLNFTWVLPYTRTLFSSEMMSSLFFFGTLLLYDYYKDRDPGYKLLALVGFLFCLSFYFRFQAAFGMAGVAVWLLFFEKKYKHIIPLALGFIVGIALNVLLDYAFYKEWVFTPYTYFYANIIDGRADYFGRSSFLRYIGLILLVTPAPLLSFVFFFYLLKTSVKQYANPVVLSVVLFIVFHSMVGHKEERFLFPVFNAFPLMIGWSIPSINNLFSSGRRWLSVALALVIGITLFVNILLLTVMTFVPYSQTIMFSRKLKETFSGKQQAIYCIGQAPFETPSGNQMEFYKMAARNISITQSKKFDSAALRQANPTYLTASYNSVKDHFGILQKMGYRPVMSSSSLLWGVNEFLHSRKINTINEIWMLYEKKNKNTQDAIQAVR